MLDQPWSRPDRTLRPPPEPPLPPNPPAPPPPPCTQELVPAPVYSWWPRGATLLDGSSAPEVPSVPTGNVTIENAPRNVPDEAPNEAPDKTPGPVRTITIDLTLGMYKGPHTGDYLSPEYISREFNALTDNIAPTVEPPNLSLPLSEWKRSTEVYMGHCSYCSLQHVQSSEHCPYQYIALQLCNQDGQSATQLATLQWLSQLFRQHLPAPKT